MSTPPGPSAGLVVFRRMSARSREEPHRAATPLELFFDLCFVVAVAQSGKQLVHFVAEGHTAEGIAVFGMTFTAVWWAWMNFTWFASAYDADDAAYRVMTLIQMTGVLILAAGIPAVGEGRDFLVLWLGYLVMRLALAGQWLRAAAGATGAERTTNLRYAAGVTIALFAWLLMFVVPEDAIPWMFVALMAVELSVPVLAERRHQTPWHPHHIAERYGLFTIIVLGETIAADTVAVQEALDEHDALSDLLPIAAGGLLIVFAAWWIYFRAPIADRLRSNRQAFLWGYGHLLIFAPAAAVGAGIEIAVEQATGHAHISQITANAAVTVPAALLYLMIWAVHSRHHKHGLAQQSVLPVAAAAILLCTFAGDWAVLAAGGVSVLAVATGVTLSARAASAPTAGAAQPH